MLDLKSELDRVSLYGQDKVAVITGGTTGMGAACARLLASKGCATVIVVGRDATRGNAVAESVNNLGGDGVEGIFVKGNFAQMLIGGNLKSMREVMEKIKTASGGHVDYLVCRIMTQKGIPNGTVQLNTDGEDTAFAVQCISRFYFAYSLIKSGFLRPGAVVLTVCNPGQDMPDLTVDDLSLKQRDLGRRALFMAQSKVESVVIDAFYLEMIKRYPEYRFLHFAPGVVRSETFSFDPFPFPFNYIVRLAVYFAPTPDQFVVKPLSLALSEEAAKEYPGHFYGPQLKPLEPGSWARNPVNREGLWTRLMAMVEGAESWSNS